jgi:hypothetical protein
VPDQLLGHGAVHQGATGHLVHAFVVGLPGLLRERHVIDRDGVAALAAAAAGELRPLSHRPAFVVQLPGRNRPAAVDLPDDGVISDVDTVEELLAEFF